MTEHGTLTLSPCLNAGYNHGFAETTWAGTVGDAVVSRGVWAWRVARLL
jgi:hypothetical protein